MSDKASNGQQLPSAENNHKGLTALFVAMFFLLCLGGAVLTFLPGSITIGKELTGVVAQQADETADNADTCAQIMDGTFFTAAEERYNDRFALNNLFIRTNNTLEFLAGESSNSSVVMGNHGQLFESWYLKEFFCLNDRYDGVLQQQVLQARAEEVAQLKELLQERGIALYVMINPSKLDYFAEDVPLRYRYSSRSGDGETERNSVVFKQQLNRSGVPVMDTCAYFATSLPEGIDIYPQTGVHYTWASAYYAWRELFSRIQTEYGIPMPTFDIVLEETNEIVQPNRDIFELLNTFDELTYPLYYSDVQQLKPRLENIRPEETKITVFGDSYIGPFISMVADDTKLFGWADYMQNTFTYTHTNGYKVIDSLDDIDLEALLQSDVIVLEVTEGGVSQDVFSMLPRWLDYLSANSNETDSDQASYPDNCSFEIGKTYTSSDYEYGLYIDSAESCGWVFTDQAFGYGLQNPLITTYGLRMRLGLYNDLETAFPEKNYTISVKINGTDMGEYSLDESGCVVIPASDLPYAPKNIYLLDCESKFFCRPIDVGDSTDNRVLSYILIGIDANIPEGGEAQ